MALLGGLVLPRKLAQTIETRDRADPAVNVYRAGLAGMIGAQAGQHVVGDDNIFRDRPGVQMRLVLHWFLLA